MKVIVYGSEPPIPEVIEGIKARRGAVLLRNPRYFRTIETETCDAVVALGSLRNIVEIVDAYEARGIPVLLIGAQVVCTATQSAQYLGTFTAEQITSGEPFAALRG